MVEDMLLHPSSNMVDIIRMAIRLKPETSTTR